MFIWLSHEWKLVILFLVIYNNDHFSNTQFINNLKSLRRPSDLKITSSRPLYEFTNSNSNWFMLFLYFYPRKIAILGMSTRTLHFDITDKHSNLSNVITDFVHASEYIFGIQMLLHGKLLCDYCSLTQCVLTWPLSTRSERCTRIYKWNDFGSG